MAPSTRLRALSANAPSRGFLRAEAFSLYLMPRWGFSHVVLRGACNAQDMSYIGCVAGCVAVCRIGSRLVLRGACNGRGMSYTEMPCYAVKFLERQLSNSINSRDTDTDIDSLFLYHMFTHIVLTQRQPTACRIPFSPDNAR